MKTKTFFIILIFLIIGFGFYVWLDSDGEGIYNGQNTNFTLQDYKSSGEVDNQPETPSSDYIGTVKEDNEVTENNDVIPSGLGTAEPEQQPGYVTNGDEINILVDSPKSNQVLTSPFTVSGKAKVFAELVYVNVTDPAGNILISEVANTHSSDAEEFGSYSITLNYQFSATKEGFVEVYSKNGTDNQKNDLVRIPVVFE